YPDASYSRLKLAISKYLNVEPDMISVGCGSSELISRVCEVLVEEMDKVVIPMPSYSLYMLYAFLRNASVVTPIFKNYELEVEAFEDLKAKLTIICSPNNPTGNTVGKKVVERIAENSEYVLIDEAYAEFSDESFVDFVTEFDNIIILRSFSKFFGLAGLRIGYAISSRDVAEAIEKIRLPFAISTTGLETAISAIESLDYYQQIKKEIVLERERVSSKLREMGFEVLPSKANFLLVKVDGEVFDFLLKRGIVVRKIERVLGLEGSYLRITIGKKEENDALLDAIKSYSCESSA
ncbi:MAG: histidinol-phosphate transaminase, partial [Archaeoglobaceae archaeon]